MSKRMNQKLDREIKRDEIKSNIVGLVAFGLVITSFIIIAL